MSIILSLELNAPRLRPNAFPWGVAEVKLTAAISSSSSQCLVTRVNLPSIVDVRTVIPQLNLGNSSDDADNGLSGHKTSLDIEIEGCDHGITFAVGMGTVEMPVSLQPGPEQTSSTPYLFRLPLIDGTGVRVGTISGAFIARRTAIVPTSLVASSAADAGHEGLLQEGMIDDHHGKCPVDTENKVAALLDLAGDILASSSRFTGGGSLHRRSFLSAEKIARGKEDEANRQEGEIDGGRAMCDNVRGRGTQGYKGDCSSLGPSFCRQKVHTRLLYILHRAV